MSLFKKLPVVILSGGFGSRLDNLTKTLPKPLVRLDNDPIIYHILKIFVGQGLSRFYLATGYKDREFFNYFKKKGGSKVKITKINKIIKIELEIERVNCVIYLIYTGLNTMTGGRLKKIAKFIKDDTFFLTYGDGLSSVNIKQLINLHKKNKKLATVLAVKPIGRFGIMKVNNNTVTKFLEKPTIDEEWINGGFFVLNKKIFKYINNKNNIWEKEPLENLSKDKQLNALKFNGFWFAMDTLRDKNYLEDLWISKKAPWKIWDDK